MYQVKCGNISTPVWRDARNKLLEMFLVPLSNLQVPEPVVQYSNCNPLTVPAVAVVNANVCVTAAASGSLLESVKLMLLRLAALAVGTADAIMLTSNMALRMVLTMAPLPLVFIIPYPLVYSFR
ncbi:hypothetical protein IH979_02930, partial [Patescibacteria group bacterium]|nr:hypothetical protein [Patescibacteria group bacterium]